MSMVCTICQDLVTERPQSLMEGEELVVLAMQCGHIFHSCCIQEWFQKLGLNATGQCPCCKTMVAIGQALRLFPSGDEEGQAIAEKIGKVKEQTEELKHLKGELEQINMILEDVGCQLENEKVVHEILKFEHAEKLSEMEELRRRFEEQVHVNTSRENYWQEVVEKANNEKEQAVIQLQATETSNVEDKQKLEEFYGNTISQLEKKLELESANKDCTKVRRMEQIHLHEIKELEKQLNRKPMINKSCQTDGRDASLLQARLVSYKSCMLHMKSEIQFLESEYDKLQKMQPTDPNFGSFLLNDALNKSIDMTLDDSSGDSTDTQEMKEPKESGDKMAVSMCVDIIDGEGDASIPESLEIQIDDKPGNTSDDVSQSTTSGNEEYTDAPLWCN